MIPAMSEKPSFASDDAAQGGPGMTEISLPYSMLIQWSDEDRVYVVSLPE